MRTIICGGTVVTENGLFRREVVVENGRILEEGKREDLLMRNGAYAALEAAQALGE